MKQKHKITIRFKLLLLTALGIVYNNVLIYNNVIMNVQWTNLYKCFIHIKLSIIIKYIWIMLISMS